MKKFIKNIFTWFKDLKFADWLGEVFKYQLGKIASIIYKDAIDAVTETKELCDFIVASQEDYSAIQNIIEDNYGIRLNFEKINDIRNGKMRIRFDVAKELLIKELKSSGKDYKEYVVDTVIQLAYSFLKERGK